MAGRVQVLLSESCPISCVSQLSCSVSRDLEACMCALWPARPCCWPPPASHLRPGRRQSPTGFLSVRVFLGWTSTTCGLPRLASFAQPAVTCACCKASVLPPFPLVAGWHRPVLSRACDPSACLLRGSSAFSTWRRCAQWCHTSHTHAFVQPSVPWGHTCMGTAESWGVSHNQRVYSAVSLGVRPQRRLRPCGAPGAPPRPSTCCHLPLAA